MQAKEIRSSFIDFFKNKQHQCLPSASVIPAGDPTLIFTNAGMNQFKDIFLGLKNPPCSRVCNSQKCIRVSGKHNDLEEVGVDTYHHTFFEMLGNWSFGDYYKKEAVSWAWELLTRVWHLPKEKLYATVYKSDREAAELWRRHTDIPPDHILSFGEKENFWEMGGTGPCGPCSELHIDLGPTACDQQDKKDHECGVNRNCSRFIEIWNLVFIQYNRLPNGHLEELKQKHIDTGMGLERITAVLQHKYSNYDTDIFTPLIKAVTGMCKTECSRARAAVAMRVIADHIRAITFAVADGVTPSNEGRGYVIRRILRRAYRYGRTLGFKAPFLYKLVKILVNEMGGIYPEIKNQQAYIEKIIFAEEENFNRTLDNGLTILNNITAELLQKNKKIINGGDVFTLYDTYGFPPDLTALIAGEKGLTIDQNGFDKAMQRQKHRSRGRENNDTAYLQEILKKLELPTSYIGERETKTDAKLVTIIKNNKTIPCLQTGEKGILIFNQTVFYGESGGQVGDTGLVYDNDNTFKVTDTQKIEDYFLHYGTTTRGTIENNNTYTLAFNQKPRQDLRKNHSVTHLLQQALKNVLGNHVRQAGSRVTPQSSRFDFNHFSALSRKQLDAVQLQVNQAICANYPVDIKKMSMDAAKEAGALAFFDEKYGNRVRVVSMGTFSTELCGGSHVRTTGEIGSYRIISESSSASGIRRIEGVTGLKAYHLYNKEKKLLEQTAAALQAVPADTAVKAAKVVSENAELKKKITALTQQNISGLIKKLKPEKNGSCELISYIFTDTEPRELRQYIDQLKNKNENTIIFFAVKTAAKIIFLCGVSKDLTVRIQAGNIVKKAAAVCGGGGGGRPDFAQAGGRDPDQAEAALTAVKKYLRSL
ncbi:MAG TPA: alanine--tRNA ligase [Spirochaetota bacterium]|nr:alanine--tRNA ligase [Spirochaetota bacterium]